MRAFDNAVLSCKDLTKSYRIGPLTSQVLKKVNLEIYPGSITLIYGKSGSGKTTLLNLLAGIDQATKGEVYFEQTSYQTLTESKLAKLRGDHYGFVFQAFHLIKHVSVEENIKCPAYINGKTIDGAYFSYLIHNLDINSLLTKMPYELSGGEQQRVAIARAMILKPAIVFADEPTGNLDSVNTKLIANLFKELNKKYGTTFIIVTHEENLMEECEQILRIKDGEIIIEKKYGK